MRAGPRSATYKNELTRAGRAYGGDGAIGGFHEHRHVLIVGLVLQRENDVVLATAPLC